MDNKSSCRFLLLSLFGLISILLPSCAAKMSVAKVSGVPTKNVLLIINDDSSASREIGAYYVSKRNVPDKCVVHIKCTTDESVDYSKYREQIEGPVKDYIAKNNLTDAIDFLVLTKGIPIRSDKGLSVDGMLMCMDKNLKPGDFAMGVPNPYFGKKEHFSHKNYGLYLATRLDGYSVADAKALVDHSLAAKPQKGTFLLDMADNQNSGSYRGMNLAINESSDMIKHNGYDAYIDSTKTFVGGMSDLMGYFSWGSNDSAFNQDKYKSNKFSPGAIAETAVSTSGRTFNHTTGGQSLIADLIESGVTGVKGYVSEPYLTAIADPRILFDSYLSGYDLAESFYMASRLIYWKDVVIGDPLCAPYAVKKQ